MECCNSRILSNWTVTEEKNKPIITQEEEEQLVFANENGKPAGVEEDPHISFEKHLQKQTVTLRRCYLARP